MSRPPRILSSTGLYHVIFRGINHLNIFEEKEDYQKILEIIAKLKEKEDMEIYAYCLMTNHVHLFLKEKEIGDIKRIMHKMLTTYVVWYNRKYKRSGSLIGNRYKSEPIEDDKYYFALVRYIHQNPVRAQICKLPEEYKWSSYSDYVSKKKNTLTDKSFTLDMFSSKISEAINCFKEFHQIDEEEDFNITNTKRLTAAQINRKIEKISGMTAESISQLPRAERNSVLRGLRTSGITIGQLERATGISRGIITKAK